MAQDNEVFGFWPWLQSPVWFCPQNLVSDLRNPFSFSFFYKDCFRTAVLPGANFLMFVGAQGTDNCSSTTYTFRKIADYLPVIEKLHSTFLLSLSHFSLYDTFCICISFQCGYFALCLAKVSQNEKHLSPHGRQVPALTGCSYRGSFQATLITFLALCIGDLLSESQSLPSSSLQGLGRFPFWCWNLPSQTLYDDSSALESTAQKIYM